MRERPSKEFLAPIRAQRRALDLTLRDVQDRTGLAPSFLSTLERGRCEPGAVTLSRLSRVLGVSIDWIVHGPAT